MSNYEDLLWPLQRQARTVQDVLADARQVWRDSNARSAEQRFFEPRQQAEDAVLASLASQHRALEAASAEIGRAEQCHRQAEEEGALVRERCERGKQCAFQARSQSDRARATAAEALSEAESARSLVHQANAAGE